MTPRADAVGVMVVRIWTERSDDSLRARLTQTLDLSSRKETTRVAGSEEEIVAIVREWIGAFLDGDE